MGGQARRGETKDALRAALDPHAGVSVMQFQLLALRDGPSGRHSGGRTKPGSRRSNPLKYGISSSRLRMMSWAVEFL